MIHREGQDQTVSLYAISGLELAPQYLWLDADKKLFALAHGWVKAIAGSIRPNFTRPSESSLLPDKVNQYQARGEFGRDGHFDDVMYLWDKFKPRFHQTHDKSWRR